MDYVLVFLAGAVIGVTLFVAVTIILAIGAMSKDPVAVRGHDG